MKINEEIVQQIALKNAGLFETFCFRELSMPSHRVGPFFIFYNDGHRRFLVMENL